MNKCLDATVKVPSGPDALKLLQTQLHEVVDEAVDQVCHRSQALTLYEFEQTLWPVICLVYRLLTALFLAARHQRLDLSGHLAEGWTNKNGFARKKLKTQLGSVEYGRVYLRRGGWGWFPLDAELGITSDGFSWRVVDLTTQLATRMSYAAVVGTCQKMLGWSPSAESIEALVIGQGSRPAFTPAEFMQTLGELAGDGEVLVIELDGKASPMATEAELEARRGKRSERPPGECKCQRHRGRKQRQAKPKERKKRGHNGKNGRSATLVAMYTLRLGEDGKLHGPVNKKIWGQFGSRHAAMQWARDQATRRGFGPQTDKRIQVVFDGERCFQKGMKKLFPNAIFSLDVRHPQERLWKLGRRFHKEGSEELRCWVESLTDLLLEGRIPELLQKLREIQAAVAPRGPGTKARRTALKKELHYLEARQDLMQYDELRKQDLVQGTGVIEGACRYVLGERLDCSGMRWTLTGAEPVLQLRCIELNGDWQAYMHWSHQQALARLKQHKKVQLRRGPPKNQQKTAA